MCFLQKILGCLALGPRLSCVRSVDVAPARMASRASPGRAGVPGVPVVPGVPGVPRVSGVSGVSGVSILARAPFPRHA